jgi:FkbM family methyltransferase
LSNATKYTRVYGDVELARHRDRISLFVESGRGSFEPETLALWESLQDPDKAALDIGAYTGLFSIVAAKAGAAEVYALEPNPRAARRARHNFRHNDVAHIELIEAAASVFSGEGRLEIGDERLALCSTSKLRKGEGTRVITIDLLVQSACTCEVGCLKMDVEGHEVAALGGAAELLENESPVLIIEVDSGSGGDREAEVTALLEEYGYEPQERLDGRNRVYRKLPN